MADSSAPKLLISVLNLMRCTYTWRCGPAPGVRIPGATAGGYSRGGVKSAKWSTFGHFYSFFF